MAVTSASRTTEAGTRTRPSYFLAVVGRLEGTLGPVPERLLSCAREGDELLTVAAGSSRGHILVSPTASCARIDSAPETTVVFHGELYPARGSSPAEYCLQRYLREGLTFLSGLHGSFVFCVVDEAQRQIVFVTDPIGSRKLFFGNHDGASWFSTAHSFDRHPVSGAPDATGLAHCLVNGVPMGSRTPFAGVSALGRASIHKVDGCTIKSEPYWRYEPQPKPGRSTESFRAELGDALLAAVERRLPSEGEVCLSLSGGYDSTALLGAFDTLTVPDVRCFTYKKPTESDRSDASVARQMAAISGYQHTELEAYGDSVVQVIGENVRWGNGLTRLVVETDAWRTLRRILPVKGQPTFWVADVCFGMSPPRTLRSNADVLNSLAFGDWSCLGSLRRLFPRSVSSLLSEALAADLESMLEDSRAIADPYVLRDYLYLDQRLQRLLSWREAFAEPCGEVRNPLLDREVLELRQYFPQSLALGKALFKDTVTGMFPELFAVDRAAAGTWHAGRWCRAAVRTQSQALTDLIRGGSSPLDSYLPPERLLRVIEQERSPAGTLRRVFHEGRTLKGRARKRLRTATRPTSPALRPQRSMVDPAVFVLRAIALRELFRKQTGNTMN